LTAVALWGAPSGGSGTDPEPLVTEVVLKAPPAEVWKAFSTPEGYKLLGVAHCEMDFRVGGLIRSHYDPNGRIGDEGTIENEILSFEPGRMLSIRVHKPPAKFPFREETWKGTWSVITLTDLGDGRTHLRIAGLGYPDTDEGRKMRTFFRSGNAWVVSVLRKHLDPAAAAPESRAHPDATVAPIVHERVIDLPRSEVWALYATGAGWKKFFGAEARIEHRPGGPFEILFDAGAPAGKRGSEGCTVLSLVPEEMISYTWSAPPKFAHARTRFTWVVVRLEAIAPSRTRVRIDHHGFAEQAAEDQDHRAEWTEVRGYFQTAWGKVLDALEAQGAK
jgi:uncharacterized protein YndB with AHSA1/START domain